MAEDKEHSALQAVLKELGNFYNIRNKSDFIDKLIDLNLETEKPKTIAAQLDALQKKSPSHKLGDLFLDVTEGASTIPKLLKAMEDYTAGADAGSLLCGRDRGEDVLI